LSWRQVRSRALRDHDGRVVAVIPHYAMSGGTLIALAADEIVLDRTKLLLDRLARRLRAQRIEVEFSDEAVRLLAKEGFDPEFGARPLRRTIQRLVENELSCMVLGGSVNPGDRVRVDVLEGDLHFEVESGAAEESSQEAAETAGTPEPAGRPT
jgi:hypothetical protein